MYSELQPSAPVSPHSAGRYCGCCQEGPQEKVPHQEIWLSLKLVPEMKKAEIKLWRINVTAAFCEQG